MNEGVGAEETSEEWIVDAGIGVYQPATHDVLVFGVAVAAHNLGIDSAAAPWIIYREGVHRNTERIQLHRVPPGVINIALQHLSIGGHYMGDATLRVPSDVVRGPRTVIHLREHHRCVVGGSGKEKKPIFDISHLTLRKMGW